ncbi:DUF7410 domain-containing protein [Natronorubrum halophilum]|uniref:DUF7410 domain-containing protein n=1 Tax=Natronorubrum halophilum TaxID=1702106 RepID=UPI001EE92E3E|nr:hypothetical protein [Natronorubrum halophilum]
MTTSGQPDAIDHERFDDGDVKSDGPNTVVRGDEPAVQCPYCGQPFHDARLETLHRGLEHPARISDREQAAFERAYLEERAEIRRFRLQALGALILVYFCMLFLYAVVT